MRWHRYRPDAPDNPAGGKHEKIGDAAVMPATKDRFPRMSRSLAGDWWKKAERLAGLEPKWGRGRHSLRRKFASDLKDLPLATADCFAMCRTVLSRTRFIRVC